MGGVKLGPLVIRVPPAVPLASPWFKMVKRERERERGKEERNTRERQECRFRFCCTSRSLRAGFTKIPQKRMFIDSIFCYSWVKQWVTVIKLSGNTQKQSTTVLSEDDTNELR